MDKEKLKKLLLNSFKEAEAIYLFGSIVKGNFDINSDIDIAVLYKKKLNPLFLYKIKEELFLILNRDIDLIDLHSVDDVFAYEIINNALKLKTSKFSEEYEMRIWYRYLDLQEDRKVIIKALYG